jgi:hypothetical protein
MANRLTMAEIDRSLTLHTTEHSNRGIARLLRVDRESVGKYVAQFKAHNRQTRPSGRMLPAVVWKRLTPKTGQTHPPARRAPYRAGRAAGASHFEKTSWRRSTRDSRLVGFIRTWSKTTATATGSCQPAETHVRRTPASSRILDRYCSTKYFDRTRYHHMNNTSRR